MPSMTFAILGNLMVQNRGFSFCNIGYFYLTTNILFSSSSSTSIKFWFTTKVFIPMFMVFYRRLQVLMKKTATNICSRFFLSSISLFYISNRRSSYAPHHLFQETNSLNGIISDLFVVGYFDKFLHQLIR